MSPERRLANLRDERARRRDELFEGPRPTLEQFLVCFGYDSALTSEINKLVAELKGEDDE